MGWTKPLRGVAALRPDTIYSAPSPRQFCWGDFATFREDNPRANRKGRINQRVNVNSFEIFANECQSSVRESCENFSNVFGVTDAIQIHVWMLLHTKNEPVCICAA